MPSLTAYKLALLATFMLAPLSAISAPSPASLSPRAVEGINCDGSSQCKNYKGKLQEILDKVNQIVVGTVFPQHEQIACAGFDWKPGNPLEIFKGLFPFDGLCVSVCENTEQVEVGPADNGQSNSIGAVIGDLLWHGCEACGTAPTIRGPNQLSTGCISVNYVTVVCSPSDTLPCKVGNGTVAPGLPA